MSDTVCTATHKHCMIVEGSVGRPVMAFINGCHADGHYRALLPFFSCKVYMDNVDSCTSQRAG
jgi:hypothetical protein